MYTIKFQIFLLSLHPKSECASSNKALSATKQARKHTSNEQQGIGQPFKKPSIFRHAADDCDGIIHNPISRLQRDGRKDHQHFRFRLFRRRYNHLPLCLHAGRRAHRDIGLPRLQAGNLPEPAVQHHSGGVHQHRHMAAFASLSGRDGTGLQPHLCCSSPNCDRFANRLPAGRTFQRLRDGLDEEVESWQAHVAQDNRQFHGGTHV